MHEWVDDFIEMNQAGLVLELCEKYYDTNVVMLSNGSVFAESMKESYNKQKKFIDSVIEFDVTLVSKIVKDNISELIFSYKMLGADSNITQFTGKHVQTWKGNKIVREEYSSIE
jgi:G:T/U-mismatch repair DNA glycosylase